MPKTLTPAADAQPQRSSPENAPEQAPAEAPNPDSGGCFVRDPATGAIEPDPAAQPTRAPGADATATE
jgi:hypothetical protein